MSGLAQGDIHEMTWTSVHGWVSRGGAELGANRREVVESDYERIAMQLRKTWRLTRCMIGGWMGYQFAYEAGQAPQEHPEFGLPILCLPATINNDLPGTELTIGADTALNTIMQDVDKLKEAALAARRCFSSRR